MLSNKLFQGTRRKWLKNKKNLALQYQTNAISRRFFWKPEFGEIRQCHFGFVKMGRPKRTKLPVSSLLLHGVKPKELTGALYWEWGWQVWITNVCQLCAQILSSPQESDPNIDQLFSRIGSRKGPLWHLPCQSRLGCLYKSYKAKWCLLRRLLTVTVELTPVQERGEHAGRHTR